MNQTIHWVDIPKEVLAEGWKGFSLLVDDVERYTGNALNYTLTGLDAAIPHFFRLAVSLFFLLSSSNLSNRVEQYTSGDSVSDFTMPATLWPNGTWIDPLPGPS